MAETDLSGFDDADTLLTEIPIDSDEHILQTVYHALRTPRGYDREDTDGQGWWCDLVSGVQTRAMGALQGMANEVANTLLEVDPRVERVSITVTGIVNGIATYDVEIVTRAGAVLSVAMPAELPGVATEDDGPPPGPPAETKPQIVDLATSPGVHPFWILGRNAGRLPWVVGTVMDTAAQRLMDGLFQKFPDYCESEALPYHCRQYGIRRGLNESEESIRTRLKAWLATWRRAGSAFAILDQIQSYFLPATPTVHLVQHRPVGDISSRPTRATWSTRVGGENTAPYGARDSRELTTITTPSNFDFDSLDGARPAQYPRLSTRDPRLAVIIEQNGDPSDMFYPRQSTLATTSAFGFKNGVLHPDLTNIPANLYADLESMVRQWKAAGSYVSWILVHFGAIDPSGSGADYPDGQWHNMLNDDLDGNRIPTTWRLLFVDRFPGERLPASPEPYPV